MKKHKCRCEKYIWECPDCDFVEKGWTYEDLADSGSPVCPKCDCDLKLKK